MVLTAHASHVVARLLLATMPPRRAFRAMRFIGRFFALDVPAARHVAAMLEPHGTCLTRAVAIAGRLPQACIVVGTRPQAGRPFHAHAWVEVSGHPLRSWDRQDMPEAFRIADIDRSSVC